MAGNDRYRFIEGNVCDAKTVRQTLANLPNVVTHPAAASYIDRSIDRPSAFIYPTVVSTYTGLNDAAWAAFRFHHISTDEVYGILGDTRLFTEETPYNPRSPYSASKAGSDHLVLA